MEKERLQELNTLLLSNKFDQEAYQQLSMEEAYAVFRLAAMHHKKVSENLEKLKKEQPEASKSEQQETEQKSNIKDFNEGKIKAQENVLKVLMTKATYFYSLAIERLKKLDAFYVAYAQTTNSPFVFCDPIPLKI